MNAMASARPAQFDRSAQHRRSMIGKINIARQQLNMAEDDYRQGLFETTGETSLRDCSDRQLDAMLRWLSSKGFQALPRSGKVAQHPMARKARALWISLHHLGVVHNPSEAALEAFSARQLGCERLAWARQSDAARLIEALKDMASRNGWKQTDDCGRPLPIIALQEGLCLAILERMKATGDVPAGWRLDQAMWKLCGIENRREEGWTAEDYSRLAAALGGKLREMGGAHG